MYLKYDLDFMHLYHLKKLFKTLFAMSWIFLQDTDLYTYCPENHTRLLDVDWDSLPPGISWRPLPEMNVSTLLNMANKCSRKVCFYLIVASVVVADETFHEELYVKPFKNGDVLSHFQFTTLWSVNMHDKSLCKFDLITLEILDLTWMFLLS